MARGLLEDVRYALRALRLNPGFACTAVLSLAFGIGANTAIFSLIDAILLRSLPVEDPDRLVLLSDPASSGVSIGMQSGVRSLFTYEEFEYLRDRADAFSGLFAAESNPARVDLRVGSDGAEEVRAELVSGRYFEVLGVRPVVGLAFTAADDASPGGAAYALLTHDFWQRRFGGDRAVVGRAIAVNRSPFTIVGVLPPGFHSETVGLSPELYVPMMMQPQLKPGRYWLRDDPKHAEKVMWLHVGARLKPGVTLAHAQANVDVVFRQYVEQQLGTITDPGRRRDVTDQKVLVQPGGRGASILRERFAEPLVVLMAIVGLVLLIACANVANLLLARATGRQKEVGIRVALGAGRLRLVRQLLTESLVLAVLGGTAGVLFANWTAHLLVRVASAGQTSAIPLDVGLDIRVLAFTAALSVLTGLVFGLAPAVRGTRVDVNGTLKEHARGLSGSSRRLTIGKTLVVVQVAVSLMLLVGAGLFVRTLRNLQAVDLGYARDNLLVLRIDPLAAGFTAATRPALYQRLLGEVKTLPGVRAVTVSENGLFSGTESGDQITVEGYHSDKEEDRASAFDQIGPGYFSSMGIPVMLGREFGPQDVGGAARVCVVNEGFAKFYFGQDNPLGKHVTDEFPDTRATFEIVGVARDARDHRLRGTIPRRFYVPVFQPLGDPPPSIYYIIRTASDAGSLLPAVRRKILDVNGALTIARAGTLDGLLDRTMTTERMIAQVAAFFSVIALALAAIGLYGVLAYAIARRTHEIGIRMALGAAQGRILGSVLGETMALVTIGVAVGVPAALICGRFVQGALYGVATFDPGTIAVSVLVVAIVAALAGVVPALRAARVDPLVALRHE
jgi:predicted permease